MQLLHLDTTRYQKEMGQLRSHSRDVETHVAGTSDCTILAPRLFRDAKMNSCALLPYDQMKAIARRKKRRLRCALALVFCVAPFGWSRN